MKLQKKLSIKNNEFKIKEVGKIIYDRVECDGTITFSTGEILIKKSLPDKEKLETLVHEMLHGIGHLYKIKQLQNDQYNLVDRIAHALATEFIKNKTYNLFRGLK